jgi:transcriptional regulator with XRE-family HTH domain
MVSMSGDCPGCGKPGIEWREPERYEYRESGLENVYLIGGVLLGNCVHCNETYIYVEEEDQLLQVIALDVLRKPAALTGKEMRYLREAADLTQVELAKRLRVRQGTISAWERSNEPPFAKDPMKEIGSRVYLLHSFWKLLTRDPSENHLAETHMRALKEYTDAFIKEALVRLERGEVAPERERDVRMTGSVWEPLAA